MIDRLGRISKKKHCEALKEINYVKTIHIRALPIWDLNVFVNQSLLKFAKFKVWLPKFF